MTTFFFVFSCCQAPTTPGLFPQRHQQEFITERKEGLLQGTRIVPASEEATTRSGNKSILPSWLLLDPDSLWAFEYKYGEGSSPGIVPAGSTKVQWKAWKRWRHESHIHTDWCRWSKAQTHPQPDCGAAESLVLNLQSGSSYPLFAKEGTET